MTDDLYCDQELDSRSVFAYLTSKMNCEHSEKALLL